MSDVNVEMIPVQQIRIVNPRNRNKAGWLAIVASIRSVGLKKPILVFRRSSPDDAGHTFDLVCGQGRLEAFKELDEKLIPAIITDASEPDQYLMSLVENIARRPPSYKSIYYEVRNLRERGYDSVAIAKKLGLERSYVAGVVHLVEHGESNLIQDVEAGKLPITVAIEIANGNDDGVQKALSDGYTSGEFRGPKLKAIRKLLDQRAGRGEKDKQSSPQKPLTGPALVKLYKQRVQEQQKLIAKADHAKEKLLIIASAMRSLFADEDFRTVLQAESLMDMPEQLKARMS
jgi:ParB family transcriptional regulator, chromosome partitioning protein